MIDLNREAAALLFNGAQDLMPGQELELGFTYPRIADGEFEIVHQHREARVLRAEPYNDQLQRIVVQFHQPLEDPPAAENEYLRY